MTIEQSFDDSSPEVFRAEQLIAPIPGFPETVIATYSRKVFAELLAGRHATELGLINTSAVSIPVYAIEAGGKRFAAYLSTIGGAASAGIMEEVIAMGGRRFLFFGSCGALGHEVTTGAIAVPTAAWRDEGVSYHYLPAADTIDVPTWKHLSSILAELDVPHYTTIAWTTDAIYRETRATVQKRLAAGCGVVDMECASTAAVAAFRGVEFYQFLYGADSLAGDEWDPRNLAENAHDQNARMADLAVRIAARM